MDNNEKVYLIRMSEQHLASTCHWLQESSVLREQVDCLTSPTEEGNQAYWYERWNDKTREEYGIHSADGVHVGNCGLSNIDLHRRKAELWIYLGVSRGMGLGTAALQQLLAKGFREIGLNRISLRVVASNSAAANFYLRNGFVMEGQLRHDTLQSGVWIDSLLMSMLASEFRTLHKISA